MRVDCLLSSPMTGTMGWIPCSTVIMPLDEAGLAISSPSIVVLDFCAIKSLKRKLGGLRKLASQPFSYDIRPDCAPELSKIGS